MSVIAIESRADFERLLQENPFVVVKFGASWCPPCQRCAPHFAAYAEQCGEGVVCASLELDAGEDLAEIASQNGCKSIPMFFIFQNGRLVTSKVTSSIDEVRRMVESNLTQPNALYDGESA